MAKEDIESILNGYDLREKIGELLQQEIEDALESTKGRPVIELLATLVATDCLEIRIAFCPNSQGIFHDKIGLFTDEFGSTISFTGSLNETFSGWDISGNHESFDVFRSWTSELSRVELHRQYFKSIWDGYEPGVRAIPFPRVVKEQLIAMSNPDGVEAAYRSIIPPNLIPSKKLLPHQIQAIEAWKIAGNKGIFEHATGSGKTFTAISVIKDYLRGGQPVIILVPSELLLDQWYGEIRQELCDLNIKILLVGGGHTIWKHPSIVESYTSPEGGPRITIATLQSVSNDEFLARIKGGSHLVIVIDEVHRAGSQTYSKVLTIKSGPRLGLSATPRRYGDQEGTSKILEYFDGIIEPPFTLADAIEAGRLCKYTYHIHEISLSELELQEWLKLTEKIKKDIARSPKDYKKETIFSKSLKLLLIKRARIIKQAAGKIGLAVKVIQTDYQPGDRWLIYCDSQSQLEKVREELRIAGFENDEYRSAMIGDKEATLDYFKTLGGILVAIKCLDEGIDIPSIDHALILASSKNPREFIQRRGRVLRKTSEKFAAEIHDTIVIPDASKTNIESCSFLKTEFSRAIQFSEMAMNNSVKTKLRSLAFDYDLNPDDLLTNVESDGFEED
jgi:superfamily II DNA or RNA helicase